MVIQTATLGYPRIGKNREVKKALEGFWSGKLDSESLLQTVRQVEESNWQTQLQAGIDRIGIGDTTLYDSVLDWSVYLGLIPERFQHLSGLEQYFAMARGKEGIPALEMTKWFDTNYHYLVPEISAQLLSADFSDVLETVHRAQQILGQRAVPIILGPVTLLRLSRLEVPISELVSPLCDRYLNLLLALKPLGVEEVQIHEPALVLGDATNFKEYYESIYASLAKVGLPLHLVTYFDDLGENYPWVVQLPVSSISLDFTRGRNLELIKHYGFPADKRLGVGIVDARNIWQIRPDRLLPILEEIQPITSNLSIQPSASLQFVPYDATRETKLPEPLRNVLSFAEQKLQEVVFLARTAAGEDLKQERESIQASWQVFEQFSPANQVVQDRLKNLKMDDFQRSLSYSLRLSEQIPLPPLPTTTIGSFPQTSEVRQLRVKYKRGELTLAQYHQSIDTQIAQCIKIQEEIGLDVLVHGEFERTDMVEYFGQQLSGFAFTEHGWVQSYGSRCVRPPIIYGDVVRTEPMTVREFKVAQSLTEKPVKGMLTGPVTMINWSYPRTDIARQEQAFQIALALRDEVADLEAAGAKIIQIDEPALREGLPLKTERWNEYLSWAVDSFKLSAGIAKPETQIHTHMCYSEFGDIITDIERLDADVLSIENSRSNNETLYELTDGGYSKQVGNGVYDVHSPAIPNTEQILSQLRTGIANLPVKQIWVNPDCGLKTRRWEEVVPSLKSMVQATKILREETNASGK
ncbi:5-methyltetrahydropteroyltriglutamate--homocysteine S-methyltransferase [Allocoleopsis franciscana]|uniref:5-methyltetrahydropteroyltriglutamate--homocysteine methyltransferase n=1 Tax=Allocoleopsis franciscana PCC 7113 TaxID=1173027 RepID=K9WGE6_9CYAN|nr:5-methyltetrahydropteroyltriglutamate--homocysteine S-methyltransferase [Allocoleopsis franciscana]AFZ18864.1 methionine synthase (B12-independent) [Allocoleopsis franciscana PCC 7113]